MVNPGEPRTIQPWTDAGLEPDWDDDMNDTDVFLDEEDLVFEQDYYDEANVGALAPWQRIEIVKEKRKLRSMLNELDDYDEFDYPQDDDSAEYSY